MQGWAHAQGVHTLPSPADGGCAARERLLREARARGALAPPALLPAALLEGLQWAVTEPVDTARTEAPEQATAVRVPTGMAGLATQGEAPSACAALDSPAAALAPGWDGNPGEGLSTLEEGFRGECAPGRPLAEGEWGALVLRAPHLVLLLPRGGALGLAPRSMAVEPPGLTLRALLTALHAFYAVRFCNGQPSFWGAGCRCMCNTTKCVSIMAWLRSTPWKAALAAATVRPVLAGGDAAGGDASSRAQGRPRRRGCRRRFCQRRHAAARRATGCPEERCGAAARRARPGVRRV